MFYQIYSRLCSGVRLVVTSKRSHVLFNSHIVVQSLNTRASSPINELPAWSRLFASTCISCCICGSIFVVTLISPDHFMMNVSAATFLHDSATGTGHDFNLLCLLEDDFVVVVSLASSAPQEKLLCLCPPRYCRLCGE